MRFVGFAFVVAVLFAITYMAMGMRADPVTNIEPASGGQATYTGTLTYLDRMAISPDAQLEIQIIDDQGATVADTRRPLNGAQVPVPFSISVDADRLTNGNYYLIGAITQPDGMARVTNKVSLDFTAVGDHVIGQLMTNRVNLNEANNDSSDEAGTESSDANPESSSDSQPYHNVTWRLSDLNGIAILPDSRATLVLGPDGRLHGNGGCNNIGGGYVINGDQLEVQPNMFSTMMACPGGVAEQEGQFTQQLVGTHTMIMDGDTMMLQTGDGRTLKFVKVSE